MQPFFVAAYRKFSVNEFMTFKSRAYSMTEEEYAQFYGALGNSISRRRVTDLNAASLNYLINVMPNEPGLSVLDVGSGNGYLLEQLSTLNTWARIAGVDVAPSEKVAVNFESYAGALPKLPFKDNEFDIVTCTHVIEHVLNAPASAKELIRVAREMVLVVVPRQRYYYYTLDEHLNFYPRVEPLMSLFAPFHVTASLQDGDWVLTINLTKKSGMN
jgi:ubiquinone/menaquinone biosynthesis C-methylase UbiE